jgi:hypothetical protein
MYLDTKGLLALWRETLLCKKVLEGDTKGYTNHPQLYRFKTSKSPLDAVNFYLHTLYEESLKRNYRFDKLKISPYIEPEMIEESKGQLLYEWQHFIRKIEKRSPDILPNLKKVIEPKPNPIFLIVEGNVKNWEKQ